MAVAAAPPPAATPPPAPQVMAANCALGYDRMVKVVRAQRGTAALALTGVAATAYVNTGLGVAYVFTQPGQPAHPAVYRRQIVRAQTADGAGGVTFGTSGCGFGNPDAFRQWMSQTVTFKSQLDAALGSPGMR